MSDILRHQSLQQYNTLGFNQSAEYFMTVHDDDALNEALDFAARQQLEVFVLGGGSNLVLTRDIKGLVMHCAQQHIEYRFDPSEKSCMVIAGAGVQWHALVSDTLSHGVAGLENLSLIPGQVGAAPVQNIGAYGVELKDRMHSLRALHLPSRQWRTFTAAECEFDYRHSIFKRLDNDYLITEVTFRLGECHALNTSYASLARYLDDHGLSDPTARQISEAVISIRQSRLPDPHKLGNAGSFFHNPVISRQQALALKKQNPELVTFDVDQTQVKLSAAWMIDSLGYRGFRRGDVGVYDQQALVLVNHVPGSDKGGDLIALAEEIRSAVDTHFNVQLSIEPVVM